MNKEKEIIEWSQRIFVNQAKIGEIMAQIEDQESNYRFKECLKDGVKIHKRHREIIAEYANEIGIPDYFDQVGVSESKYKIKGLKTLSDEQKVVLDASYDSMKVCDLFVLIEKDMPQPLVDKVKHLRTGYLNFIDDMLDFHEPGV